MLVTAIALWPYLPRPGWLPDGLADGAVITLALAYALLGVALMLYLFQLRRAFQDAAPPPLPPAPGGGPGEF